MIIQGIEKILVRWHQPILFVLCLGLLCGHVLPVVSSVTVFTVFVMMAVVMALFHRAPLPRIFYIVAAYFLLYSIWTWTVSLIWPQEINDKETLRFFIIPLLVISLLRLTLVSPRTALNLFFHICTVYLLLMVGIGVVEHYAGWHLPTSYAYGLDGESAYVSTGLSYNPNDYSVLLVMPALYIFAYCIHFMGGRNIYLGIVALGMCVPILIWDECLTGLTVVALAVVYYVCGLVKNRKLLLQIIAVAFVLACVVAVLKWSIIIPRAHIYIQSIASLFDSYGLGFGINGDKYYLLRLNNYDITHGITNAHSYLLQLPLTSGLLITLFYILMIAMVMGYSSRQGYGLFWIMPVLYLLLLFSPSSSLLMWGHYVFFCMYVCYAAYACSVEPINKKTN